MDVSGFARIETGENTPTRPTAQKIWRFYAGLVPLGVIYDPKHSTSMEFAKKAVSDAALVTHGNLLAQRHPKLLVRFRGRG